MPRRTTSSYAWRVEATVGEIVAVRPSTLLQEAAEGTTSQLSEGLALILIGEAVAAPLVSQTARQANSASGSQRDEWIAASS